MYAAPVTWVLENAVFSDGGTAAGSFVYDATTKVLLDYNIQISGGDESLFPTLLYKPGAPHNLLGIIEESNDILRFLTDLPSPDIVINPFGKRELRLAPVTLLTNAGGIVNIDLSNIFQGECYNCVPSRSFQSGQMVAVIPEGATIRYAITGLGLCWILFLFTHPCASGRDYSTASVALDIPTLIRLCAGIRQPTRKGQLSQRRALG
jgi:hypothetical protein